MVERRELGSANPVVVLGVLADEPGLLVVVVLRPPQICASTECKHAQAASWCDMSSKTLKKNITVRVYST